ncbi:zinc finger MYM-type protein 1-like [Myzus persicae]|uniref:zinc finger MYM-type protein 1-like n=1 Tax=Myzus persicae TaxID=13164 RepID=UPI000B930E33|nr:zinc finger MYM-type protein 1-like [Myzus persicae]
MKQMIQSSAMMYDQKHSLNNPVLMIYYMQVPQLQTISPTFAQARCYYSKYTKRAIRIIVDETQDLARHEQVSVCVRYVSKTLEPHEVFLGFYRTASTDGESLTTLIKEVILSNGLSINNIRGQCYDGAASMRGSYSGVQARIRDENKLAVYVHCYAHILNLCLVDLSKVIPHVRNTFGTLQSLYSFIGASSKRYSIFEQIMLETSSNGKNKLKSLSDTRWNCRIKSIKAVIKTLPVILKTLETISENDSLHGSDASSLLNNIQTFQFVFCLYTLNKIMEQTNILSKYLQSPSINYATVNIMSQKIIDELNEYRSENAFNEIWKVTQVNSYDFLSPKMPRKRSLPVKKIGGGSIHPEFTDVKDFYRIEMYYLILDTITQAIKDKMFISLKKEVNFENKLAYIKKVEVGSGFPILVDVFKLFLTIPMNSASCERSFSCLRRLKNYLRTTMGQTRLSDLGLLYIHKDKEVNKDAVIDEFCADNKRRINLK